MEYAIGAVIGLVIGAAVGYLLKPAGAEASPEAARGRAVADRAKSDPAFAAKLAAIEAGADVKPLTPPKPSGAALRMLALLQADSRLVDFLMEDIAGASDAQIGQAVRKVHADAQAALKRYAVIETVLGGTEGDTTTVARGFDPSAVRVVGNVTGEPPFTGQIQHPGWKVTQLKVSAPPEGADEFVLQPAEVQIT
ncbi:MAG: DUF2760 domain-containing protein [Gemmataceae bacterium]|nr:DUF2760 domain-containing protein [Gemmataceae bacterium]